MAASRVILFGAGGHAGVAIDLIRARAAMEPLEIVGLVASPGKKGDVLGIPILGSDEDLSRIVSQTGTTHFLVAIGTLRGGGLLRPRLFATAEQARLQPFTAIHPSAIVSPAAEIGPGATIMAGAVVQAGARIGRNAIINTRAGIDHDCTIGDHAHVAPGATCSGGVRIGARAHIGTGAVIIHNLEIAEDATVGAGATVIRDCAAGVTVVGTPARPIELSR